MHWYRFNNLFSTLCSEMLNCFGHRGYSGWSLDCCSFKKEQIGNYCSLTLSLQYQVLWHHKNLFWMTLASRNLHLWHFAFSPVLSIMLKKMIVSQYQTQKSLYAAYISSTSYARHHKLTNKISWQSFSWSISNTWRTCAVNNMLCFNWKWFIQQPLL